MAEQMSPQAYPLYAVVKGKPGVFLVIGWWETGYQGNYVWVPVMIRLMNIRNSDTFIEASEKIDEGAEYMFFADIQSAKKWKGI
jgi:hypothetical protein